MQADGRREPSTADPTRAGAFRRAFLMAAVAWTVALPTATWSAGRVHEPAWAAALVVTIYAVGAAVCHQLPARSFHLGAAQMPVCARCTGIYLGAALAAVAAAFDGATGAPDGRTRAPLTPRMLLALAALPTAATLAFEWSSGVTPSNLTRALAGLPLGGAVAWVIARSVR
jgi:uncharacterized membrane protein